jgi:diaminohydroxyphosphoribosylaminopyrimidine deaminase/5-amino-6-(5-phosphoribosylamino)uracil reductase
MFSAADHRYMARALQLAELGLWSTSPNPRVGCVIVRDEQIVGEGWHIRAGEPHAEVHALRAAGVLAAGATAYVTLEPCSHHGRTPPCADALLAAGVTRVVAAMTDPNPLVAGQGLQRLAAAGVAVSSGLLEEAARELNIGFVARMTRGRPWLRLKVAMSLDGKTALENGASQWITGPEARVDGHRWRARACAILSGSGTVLHDDPELNVRCLATERQPIKVIVDSRLQTPPTAKVLRGGVVLATAAAVGDNAAALQAQGAEILSLPAADGRVDLPALLNELGRRGINEVHAEGGAGLNGALLDAGLVDELVIYLAPCLLGDRAQGAFAINPLNELSGRYRLAIRSQQAVGADWRIVARLLR